MMFDLEQWDPPDPGCPIEVSGVPPSEPAWWVASCGCDVTVMSRTGPTVARQLAVAKHARRAVAV